MRRSHRYVRLGVGPLLLTFGHWGSGLGLSRWCPLAWEAFLDYRVNSLELSKPEQDVIKELANKNLKGAIEIAKGYEWIKFADGKLKGNIERAELEKKLDLLNLPIPWRELK